MNPRQEIEMLERLIDELLSGIQETLQSGENISDEFQGQIADELEATTRRLDQLRAQVGQEPEQSPEINGGAPPIEPEPQISNDAILLWQLAGGQEQAFISYLRSYPTPATQELLNNPLELSNVIDHLNQRFPLGNPELWVVNGIQKAPLNSSNVWGARYDEKSGKMKVRFQGGSEYEYDGVPANIFRAFIHGNASARTRGQNQYGRWWPQKNPSLGAALNQYIKAGGFAYRRIR